MPPRMIGRDGSPNPARHIACQQEDGNVEHHARQTRFGRTAFCPQSLDFTALMMLTNIEITNNDHSDCDSCD